MASALAPGSTIIVRSIGCPGFLRSSDVGIGPVFARASFNWAVEIKVRAERRAGELLKQMPDAKPGVRPKQLPTKKVGNSAPALSELGISYNDSSAWQQLASIPVEEFEAKVAERKASGAPLSTNALIGGKWTRAEYRQHLRQVRQENREEARQGKWDHLLWGTLLIRLESVEERILKALVKAGKINPEMTRAEAEALLPVRPPIRG